MTPRKCFTMTVAAATVAFALAGPTQAAVTYATDSSTQSNIPGLTGFSTYGNMMDGMSVQAIFTTASEIRTWADTGGVAGGVTGTGWSLSQSGDTWSNLWNFNFAAGSNLVLTKLILTGNTGYTVFDRYYDGTAGTPGSANGSDLSFTDSSIDATVTYSDIVAIDPNAAVGDLWHVLTVDFGNGIRTNFSFLQDTDNDSRYGIPEPASLGLLGLALAGLGWSHRKRKTA